MKRPTNGETDGDDADIYRKAGDAKLVELSSIAQALFHEMAELVEVATYAIPALSEIDSEPARLFCDKYAERLCIMSKLALFQRGELSDAARGMAGLLATSGSPGAKRHARKLMACIKGHKSSAKLPGQSGP
jgi:hypothetical protein